MSKTKGKYMTNDYIKQFLSEESLEALDEFLMHLFYHLQLY